MAPGIWSSVVSSTLHEWQPSATPAILAHSASLHRGGSRRLSSAIFTSFSIEAGQKENEADQGSAAAMGVASAAAAGPGEEEMKNDNSRGHGETTTYGPDGQPIPTLVQLRQEQDLLSGATHGVIPPKKRPMGCLYGKDYTRDCPTDWVMQNDETKGPKCVHASVAQWGSNAPAIEDPNAAMAQFSQALQMGQQAQQQQHQAQGTAQQQQHQAPGTEFTGAQGGGAQGGGAQGGVAQGKVYIPKPGCGYEFDLTNLDVNGKHDLENRCAVSWPCASGADGSGAGYSPDYANRPNNICPTNWSFDKKDGTCNAPRGYSGGCATKLSMLNYTPSMKAAWGSACMASWPLAPQAQPPPMPDVPPDDDTEAIANSDNPLAVALKPRKTKPPPPDADDPSNAAWAKCDGDYANKPCPMHWTQQPDGTCKASEYYKGSCPNVVNMDRWSIEMKKAFGKNCEAMWPCMGEFYMEMVLPPSVCALMLSEWGQWTRADALRSARDLRSSSHSSPADRGSCGRPVLASVGSSFL